MSEARISDDALGRALAALATDVAFPPTPATAPAVVDRLRAERTAHVRPPLPSLALWSRRRVLVLVAVGIASVLALAFAARLVLGAAEIRVQPGTSPSGTPLRPSGLGSPLAVSEIGDVVGFDVRLPDGPSPDEAYVFRTTAGRDGALLAWRSDADRPALPGTPWRQLLIQLKGDVRTLVKDVGRFEDAITVEVDGREAIWIDAPHELIVLTEEGARAFLVEGNVLIWTEGGITYRLETTLDQSTAIRLAETVA